MGNTNTSETKSSALILLKNKGFTPVLLSLIYTLGLLEIGVRIYTHYFMVYDTEMWKYSLALKEKSANPQLRHVHRPNSKAKLMGVDIEINSKRLRDYEHPYEKPKDTYRILVLGDSLTLGWGVPFEATYPKRLEKMLPNQEGLPGGKFEVINTGIGNWNTSQEVEFLISEGLKYHPDMVILGYFLNDAEPIIESRVDQKSWLNKSFLFVFLCSRISKIRMKFDKRTHFRNYYADLYKNEGWERVQKAFKQLADISKQHNAQVVVMQWPDLHILDPSKYPFRFVHERVGNEAEKNGFAYLDLLPYFEGQVPEELVVAQDDSHPNAKANQIAAEALFRFINQRDLLPENKKVGA